ncbi:AAA family ATPase [Fusobacterium polymorphum]|uniref:AAA family ATPase n=1 Tax=Fusobacterium nucleatum subsp. polymorphum TaxID=76857 RepID=UPI002B4BE213|nr:AAA family ATPase [Fusobacterium polymorphum]WRL71889.1 AAA family ATPase [Fusobacterium polymorphum]
MKRIGIGVSDFKKIIEEDFYYFDKTSFIEKAIQDGAEVKLFTRPRRFGKTLNMSMLKYFFDIKGAEENRKLFKGLYIEKKESFKEQGQYPVIFLSLKDLKARTWKEMERKIIITLSDFFSEYEYLLNELTGINFENLKNIIYKKASIDDLTTALKFLTKILYEKYNKKVVVLVDEYDSPLVSAYINGYYENAKDFFKTFYSLVLKDNNYLQMGVLTGIIRVIKAGIFSDLNNLRTYTILSDVYTDSYGLTEEEVEKSLKDYGIEAEISNVKDWYDGYRFGDSEVYNPWSILNFLQDKELRAYWVDTSGNDLINDVLKKITKDTIRALEKLFDGEGLRQNISGTSDLSKLLNENELWELLLFSGYLTIEEKIDQKNYILRLPNKEVKELFKDSFLEKYFGRGNKLSDLMEALTENRIEDYEENLQEILLTSVSYNDTKKGNEAFYHGLIMGMGLYLEGEYITKSNIESGLGRYDFLIEPKNKSKRAFIMEFKSIDSVEKLEEVSKEALKQIEDKKYDVSLKQNGIKEITYIGIAFCGKQIKISFK